MGLLDLFVVASIPVVKVLLLTSTGLFLALDRVDILGDHARNHLNKVVFFVFNPSLVAANLAKTVVYARKHLDYIFNRLSIGMATSEGNMGNLPLILVPAMCKEKGSPFGPTDVCETYALSYVSLSMAIGAVYLWLYVYNVVRVSAAEIAAEKNADKSNISNVNPYSESLLPSTAHYHELASNEHQLVDLSSKSSISLPMRMSQWLRTFSEKLNLKAVLAPSTIAAVVGFGIGMISPIRNLMIGNAAPLHVVTDSAFMLGEAAIPCLTIILGANLLQGLKGSGIQLREVIGIVVVRYIILPLLGIVIVKGAVHIGAVPSNDKLFVFLLHIQYALPPAMNIGTITQLFGAGQNECSVIMLWAYSLASISLTLWSTFFLWIIT
ncbi:Protein PIN-LIKES 1 [Bienertia sinuspersici]